MSLNKKKDINLLMDRRTDEIVDEMKQEGISLVYQDNLDFVGLTLADGLVYKRTVRIPVDTGILNEENIADIDMMIEQFVADKNDMVFVGSFISEDQENELLIDIWESYDWDEGDAPVFRDITHSVDDIVAFLNENKNTINDMLVENFK